MYGLRSAPRDWQTHWASIIISIGFLRLQSDANVYMHLELIVYILAYVDDLMNIGTLLAIRQVLPLLQKHFLSKDTGNLDHEGSSVVFLGRHLTRSGDSIKFKTKGDYLMEEFTGYNLNKCQRATTPGVSSIKRPTDGMNLLTPEEHSRYRRTVGILQWIAPVRPDLCYAVKERARSLSAPTLEDLAEVKHVLRYINGTWDLCLTIRPMTSISNNESTM